MIQRLYFHYQHSKESRDQLATLPSDVKVYDVFGADRDNLPQGIQLSKLPYLIDKQITLVTPSPFTVGTLSLQFHCLDYQDNLITTEESLFYIYINGDMYQDKAVDGVIDLMFDVSSPMTIDIEIKADTYLPFSQTIEIN